MRKTWTLGATGAALAAVLASGGCYDFDKAKEQCIADGRCDADGIGPDAGDAGDAGPDAGCTPTSDVDLPDDLFDDANCDGVDGQADAGLFVDPLNGSDDAGTPGTRESPLRTLRHALAVLRAADGGPGRLYLAGGAYDEAGLELAVPVSLHGGYVPGTHAWTRSRTNPSRLNGGTVGLTVRNLTDAGIVLEYVHVNSADAVTAGEPSIALRMVDTSGVRLRHMVLEAGLGAPGQDGADGGTGNVGKDGEPGTDAEGAATGNSGPGGTNTCNPGGVRSGGLGATGVSKQDGGPGAPGLPTALGGQGGVGGFSGNIFCNGPQTQCSCNSDPGTDGGTGTQGEVGEAGGAGSGRGELSGETWRPTADQTGGTGGVGEAGAGGGGGGGGGSCFVAAASVAGSGGGGGGGAGGCGGTGGTGGKGGGASISLLLLESSVSVEEGTSLTTRGGGRGGRGGNGGGGGAGGAGGPGGTGTSNNISSAGGTQYTTSGGNGGPGGTGGNGGNGGAGGGGAGGPSVGVWCDASARPEIADAGVTFTLGAGGPGGESQGNPGDAGMQEPTFGCPLNP